MRESDPPLLSSWTPLSVEKGQKWRKQVQRQGEMWGQVEVQLQCLVPQFGSGKSQSEGGKLERETGQGHMDKVQPGLRTTLDPASSSQVSPLEACPQHGPKNK